MMKNGDPLPSWIWFDPATTTYSFVADSNAMIGIIDLAMKATITDDSSIQLLPAYSYEYFQLEFILNIPPEVDTDPANNFRA